MSLLGKTVVITGGSSGIGARIGLQAANKGALPVLLARSEDKLDGVREMIQQYTGVESHTYKLDVSDADAVSSVFDEIFEKLDMIDVLVNNAGFGVFDLFRDADLDDLKKMLDVNVFGLMACTKKVLPRFLVRNEGHIINVASLAGKIATPKSTAYSATKHAVLGFSNGLRMELAETNIHVTTVNPGPVNTNFFNIADKSGEYVKNVEKYMLEPDDVARR
ncbi:MAG TPA: SDR family oxidoreductase, partial [Bacillales bacterium]|nr:SDR family oxidoreductase [Bacillales bacterium]